MSIVFTFNSPKCHLMDKKCEKKSVELYRLGKVNALFTVDPNKVLISLVDLENLLLCHRHIGPP